MLTNTVRVFTETRRCKIRLDQSLAHDSGAIKKMRRSRSSGGPDEISWTQL